MNMVLRGGLSLVLLVSGWSAMAVQPRPQLAAMTCAALDQAVTALPAGPVLVASYPPLDGHPAPILALRGVAFTYDNALASIALFACGKAESARRIADALTFATRHDPEYQDGRLRNAYAAGAVGSPSMKLPGYWSVERNAWNQDAYQVSSATAIKAALALLEAYRQSGEASYLEAARKVLYSGRRKTPTTDNRPPDSVVVTTGTFSPNRSSRTGNPPNITLTSPQRGRHSTRWHRTAIR